MEDPVHIYMWVKWNTFPQIKPFSFPEPDSASGSESGSGSEGSGSGSESEDSGEVSVSDEEEEEEEEKKTKKRDLKKPVQESERFTNTLSPFNLITSCGCSAFCKC